MEKKYYQIITKTPEDWKVVHKLLMQDGTLEDNIPERSIECVNDIKHSKTRSTYLMTDDEAELLRQSDRIYAVALDPNFHDEVRIKSEPTIKKYNRNVRNYRALRKFNVNTKQFDYGLPTSRFDGRMSDEFYRTGYQILRCTQDNNPFSSDPGEVKYQDIDYSTDGTDVDVIIFDSHIFFGHPEFCSNEYDPPNYVRGNVLSRHGICGLLDLYLDAPYYLDPEWFDADPTNRLEKRWDGTTVPKEQVAREWWLGPQYRSSSFPDFGGLIAQYAEYTRETVHGKDQATSPTPTHGTPCAGLAFGKNYGWAFNSNKWILAKNNYAGNGSAGIEDESAFNIIKIFQKYKPDNPKFGTKDPTVVSASWRANTLLTGSGIYNYRNNVGIFNDTPEIPNFLKNTQSASTTTVFPKYHDPTGVFSASIYAGREMILSGVIFVCASGNDGRYLGTPSDEDFDNYFIPDTTGRITEKSYTNRPGYPAQIGYFGQTTRYDTFVIGGIDDEYTGRPIYDYDSSTKTYTISSESNSIYNSEPSGKETTMRRRGTLRSNDLEGDYTNKGSGIDFYAPAEGTLTAAVYTSTSGFDLNDPDPNPFIFPNPYQKFSNITYYDANFSGTSAACPVTAGLIACFVQNNRDMNPIQVKEYLRSQIPNQSSSKFFIGPRPGNDPNDSAWLVPYSTMGRAVKIIREVTSRNATTNPTFTPTYGIASNFGANERFVITQNSGLTNKIEILGIKNFDETPATYELNIKNGYYRVGSRSNLTYDQLKTIKLRVDPTNVKKLQLSDSDGAYGWDDMEITVTNGEFVQSSTEIYYKFSGGTLPNNNSSSSAAGPAFNGAPGSGKVTGSGDLIVGDYIIATDDIIGLASDERLKENIKPIENALDKVEKLDGFTYNFNEIGEKLGFDSNQRYSGVSAQDVQNVLPEASAPAPRDNNYLTVKYDKLIPLLIESIKDLKNDIDDIKKNDSK